MITVFVNMVLKAGFITLVCLLPILAFGGPVGSGFESKVGNLQEAFLGFILPVTAILGIAWCGVLAATGDASARPKIVMILVCSIIAFLAPGLISWLRGLLN